MSKGGGGGQVAGYRYYLSMLMGLCRGPVDAIVAIKADVLDVWRGSITDNSTVQIDQPNLFGGDTKEGGIQGPLIAMFGAEDQDISGTPVQSVVLGRTVTTILSVGDRLVLGAPSEGTTVTSTTATFGTPPATYVTTVTSVVVDGATTSTTVVSVDGGPPTTTVTETETINLMSMLRGVTSLFFNGLICSNNPYPKAWSIRVQRALKGWAGGTAWYPAEAIIALQDGFGNSIAAMNPAHIIYECLTNPVWGRGLSPAGLDEPSFISAANTLCREQFGLCMAWSRATELGDFLQTVFNHIGAALYVDRTTGLLNLRLIRQDYNPADLPVFDYSSGLLQITDDTTTAVDNSHSEIIVNWIEPVTNSKRQTRVQNLAGVIAAQTMASTTIDYLGIPTASLAARAAQRDLMMQGSGVKRYTLKFDRRGRKINPAGVFRINVPDRNISNMVLRAGNVSEGPITDQTITVVAIQDVFGLEATTYLAEPERAWVPPSRAIYQILIRRIDEMNYRDTVRLLSAASLALVPVDSGEPVAVATQPSPLSVGYELDTAGAGEDYVAHGRFGWTPSVVLSEDIGYYDTDLTITPGGSLYSLAPVGSIAWLDAECVEVTAYNIFAGTMSIGRGCVDTLPVPHSAGSRIWFPELAASADGREYTVGEVVRSKLRTTTNSATLALIDTPEDALTIVGRQGMPYAPGAFQINGTRFAEVTSAIGDIVFTWADRDRITQSDHILVHEDVSTGPEAGVTYTTRIIDPATATVLRTTTGIATNTWTYDTAMATADTPGSHITVELEAVRDGIASFQHYDWTFVRILTGYGNAYGLSYGG